jgi:hypothetical protein
MEGIFMTKHDIIRKLTSRKLWVAVAAFISGLIVAFDGDAETAETVSGIILQGAAVLGYLLAEGLTDAARENNIVTLDGVEIIE